MRRLWNWRCRPSPDAAASGTPGPLAAAAVANFRQASYGRAADCLADDLDRCLTLYQFPEAHGSHRRTTDVIESPFAGVQLRTSAAKRFKKTKSGVYLVHQVLVRLAQTWRHLKAAHLCDQVPLPETKKSKGKTKTNAA
ncbi:MAG: hypothetical protein AB1601_03950 [Planctomycetota bacterium]